MARSEAEQAARQAQVQQAEADFDPLPFDRSAARAFGRVAASLRRAGRKPTARAYDAMIAAVALAHDLPLYTCILMTSPASAAFVSWQCRILARCRSSAPKRRKFHVVAER